MAQPETRIVIVMPAYNAARTLERTYADIPHDLIDQIILVDDVSGDETVDIARQVYEALLGQGRSPADARRVLSSMPPFDELEGFWNS